MADFQLDTQTPPGAITANSAVLYVDSVTKKLTVKNDVPLFASLAGALRNWNTADIVANAADTYLAGSNIAIPPHLMQAGTAFRWKFIATKTAAGVATPIWTVRVGTAGSVADAARLTFTGPAQTAVIDTAEIDIFAILRNTGVAAILAGGLTMKHNLAITGFATLNPIALQATSAGFDSTVASLIVGVSVNPGAAGVWTHQVVNGEALNI